MAIPIKCLDLDDKCSQTKLEAGCILFLFLIPCFLEEAPIYCQLEEDVPFYWQIERGGGTNFLGKSGRRLVVFYICVKNCADC